MSIYIDGKKSTWKDVKEQYGEIYCADLKDFCREQSDYTTIYSEDGRIEISK